MTFSRVFASGDSLYKDGDYLQALKALQAENLEQMIKTRKIPGRPALSDSASWEVENPREQQALCLFEMGFRDWLAGKNKDALARWTESQQLLVPETPEHKRYYRRVQLAVLRTSWSEFGGDTDRFDALLKAAVVIQELPLAPRSFDFPHQLAAEQQIVSIAEFARLLPKLGEPDFLQLFFQKQAELQKNGQLNRMLAVAPAGSEPACENLADRLLFSTFRETLYAFIDEYLQSPSGGGSYIFANRNGFRLIRVLLSLDSPRPDSFAGLLKFWLEGQNPPQPDLNNTVLVRFLQYAMETTDPSCSRRIYLGVSPYMDRLRWPDEDFQVRLSRSLREQGFCAEAARIMEAALAGAKNPAVQLERLVTLVEIKNQGNDPAGAHASGEKALEIGGDKVPARLHRLLATTCLNLRKYREAVDHLKKYLPSCGNNAEKVEIQYLIGWMYTLDKQFDQARPYFAAVLEKYPDSSFAKKSQDYLKALPKGK
ncbi:MAG: hypothetical protein PHV34_21740 [Verrucomicrobiae bacterium]|nr:hypothetical protein [Verrucomicrobiae bacterium]